MDLGDIQEIGSIASDEKVREWGSKKFRIILKFSGLGSWMGDDGTY